MAGSIASTATVTVERQLQAEDLKAPLVIKELVPLKVMDGETVDLVCQVINEIFQNKTRGHFIEIVYNRFTEYRYHGSSGITTVSQCVIIEE